jgi:hypothetical protein
MVRVVVAGSLGVLVTVLTISGSPASDQPAVRGIPGLVLDAGCQPLPGATVQVAGQTPVVTDEHGQFTAVINGETAVLSTRLAGFRPAVREFSFEASRPPVRLFMLVAPLQEVVSAPGGQRVIDPRRPSEPPRLRGRVLDGLCRPLPGASVRVLENGERRTDADGRFEFSSITTGAHDIEVTIAGFVTTTVKAVRIDDKNTGYIDVPIDRGPAREHATVFER